MADLVKELRHQIETTHQEALKALDTLHKYLAQTPSPNGTEPMQKERRGRQKRLQAGGKTSFKDQVFAVIAGDWATVREIVEKTGLTVKKVRGVLNAPYLKGRIKTREKDGRKEYKIEAEEARAH